MSRFYLIRHGENDLVGHAIAGRSPGVHLNAAGRQQAERIAQRLSSHPIDKIVSSPLERSRETAAPLAKRLHLEIEIRENLIEANFGEWTRKSIEELDRDPRWRQWNCFRSGSRIPGGESMLEVQARMIGEVERLRREHPGKTLALFSHGDPIRSILTYYLGMPLDLLLRISMSTASLSIVRIEDWGPQVECMNVEIGRA
jgi:probable phosphomutase (TIGR03848 family)